MSYDILRPFSWYELSTEHTHSVTFLPPQANTSTHIRKYTYTFVDKFPHTYKYTYLHIIYYIVLVYLKTIRQQNALRSYFMLNYYTSIAAIVCIYRGNPVLIRSHARLTPLLPHHRLHTWLYISVDHSRISPWRYYFRFKSINFCVYQFFLSPTNASYI